MNDPHFFLAIVLNAIQFLLFVALSIALVAISWIADRRADRINAMNRHIEEMKLHCESMTRKLETMSRK